MIFARARRRLTVTNVVVMVALILVLGGAIVAALDRFLLVQETSTLNSEAQQSAIEFGELSESGFRERHTSYAAGRGVAKVQNAIRRLVRKRDVGRRGSGESEVRH